MTFESLPFVKPTATRNVLEHWGAGSKGCRGPAEMCARGADRRKRYPAGRKVPEGGDPQVEREWCVGMAAGGMVKVKSGPRQFSGNTQT
jgi:hypothetical protein